MRSKNNRYNFKHAVKTIGRLSPISVSLGISHVLNRTFRAAWKRRSTRQADCRKLSKL